MSGSSGVGARTRRTIPSPLVLRYAHRSIFRCRSDRYASSTRAPPSPLAGEGGRRSRPDEGSRRKARCFGVSWICSCIPHKLMLIVAILINAPYGATPHPSSLRDDTFSRKGRRGARPSRSVHTVAQGGREISAANADSGLAGFILAPRGSSGACRAARRRISLIADGESVSRPSHFSRRGAGRWRTCGSRTKSRSKPG
jgi:hypothetical protein